METKIIGHTPGPWKINWGRNGFGKPGEANVTKIGPIGTDHDHWDGYYLTVSDDDARLIAAAPELLELLETIENDANTVPEWLWDRIGTVLCKVKGKL